MDVPKAAMGAPWRPLQGASGRGPASRARKSRRVAGVTPKPPENPGPDPDFLLPRGPLVSGTVSMSLTDHDGNFGGSTGGSSARGSRKKAGSSQNWRLGTIIL